MKTKPAKRRVKAPEDAIAIDTTQTIFSSDLLTPEEERQIGAQLGSVLDYIEKLKEVDVSGVEPTAHAFPLVNVTRPDEVRPSLPHEDAMRNAGRLLAEGGAHAVKLRHMHEAILKNGFSDHGSSLCLRHQGHVLSLHISGKARVLAGYHITGVKTIRNANLQALRRQVQSENL